MDLLLFAIALIPAIMWLSAAWRLGLWPKRSVALAAFALAGLNSIPSAILLTGGHLTAALLYASVTARIPIVGLLIMARLTNEPRHRGERPRSWRP